MRPVIGITAGYEENTSRHFLTDYYIKAIENLGGNPLILPTVNSELVEYYYALADGFIFSGGGDVDPVFFGEAPVKGLGRITPERDEFELSLARIALKGKKPVLGICRGIQILNIAAGGDVYQDISEITPLEHNQKAPLWYPFHYIEVSPESILHSLLGQTKAKVNSFHHQVVRRVGEGLKKVAWTSDGLIEAIESKDPSRTIIGVQWHPECSWDKDDFSQKIFRYLINKACERKERDINGNSKQIS